jgi:hypothetical protein
VTQPKLTGALSADDVLSGYELPTTSVSISLRGDPGAEVIRLQEQYLRAVEDDERHNRTPEAPAILERIRDLRDEVDAARVVFELRGLDSVTWEDFKTRHAASKSKPAVQIQLGRQAVALPVNVQFFEAALALAITSPHGWTPEKLSKLRSTLSKGQWGVLCAECWALNEGDGSAPLLPAVFASLRAFDGTSGTSQSAASPDR